LPLIYHFGGRDDLLRAVLGQMFGRPRESAEQQLWPDFRRVATTDWLSPLEDGLRGTGRPELATLVLAVIRGLLMDLDATGDTVRTDRAFNDFIGVLEHLPVLRGG
jgi:AcrR family transcriptional regulator